MAEITQHDINYVADRITHPESEPYATLLEAAYYVARNDPRREVKAFAVEREMLQNLVYSRALSGEMKTQDAAWRVVEELLDFAEENPK
jgi:hypothetical protein